MALDVINNLLGTIENLREFSGGGRTSPKEALQLENLYLDNISKKRALSQPTSAELRQAELRLDNAKYITNKLLELVGDANVSPATRSVYTKMVEQNMFGLPEDMRRLVIPLAKGTALDPIQQKMEQYDRHFPKPEIRDPERYGNLAYGQSMFAASEWNYKRDKFLGLSPSSPPKAHGLGDGMWAIRQDNGVVNIMSDDDTNLEELAKGLGTTSQALLASGGVWNTGPWFTLKKGDSTIRMRPNRNYFTGEDSFEMVNERGVPVVGDAETSEQRVTKSRTMPNSMEKFLTALGLEQDDPKDFSGRQALTFKELLANKGPGEAQAYLTDLAQSAYPGWILEYREKKPGSISTLGLIKSLATAGLLQPEYLIDKKDWNIIAIPATRTEAIRDASGTTHVVYVDDETGLAYDGDGRRMGRIDQLREEYATGVRSW